MATINPGTTYDAPNVALMKRSLDENILNLDPRDTPLLTLLGGLDGASGKFSFIPTSDNTKYEWMEDTLGFRSVTNSTNVYDTDDTSIVLADGDAAKLEPGHILMNGTEHMWVSAVNTSTNTITVVRAYGGSIATSITSGEELKIIGMARLEGAESDPIKGTSVTIPYNYTQILHRELSESGTMEKMQLLGKGDPWQYEAAKQVPNMLIELEHSLLYGIRQQGSATAPRAMGGIKTFITSNVQANLGTKITKTAFNTAALAMFNGSGGGDKYAIVSPGNYVELTSLFTAAETVQHTESNGNEYWWGMSPVGIYTKFGKINLYIDRWIDDSFIPIIDLNHVGVKTLRPFFIEPLAKGGDYHKQETIWEGTLCMRGDKAHALIAGITAP